MTYNKIKLTFLTALLLVGLSNLKAGVHDDFLNLMEERFDQASTVAEKVQIATGPINRGYLVKLESIEKLDETLLRQGVSSDPTNRKEFRSQVKTSPIFLAIYANNWTVFEKFLSVVQNPNDFNLLSWGYREHYTLAHAVMDNNAEDLKFSGKRSLSVSVLMITLLAEKGGDFNLMLPEEIKDHYWNPPLACGHGRGYDNEFVSKLRALALCYGADPLLKGSYHMGLKEALDPLYPYTARDKVLQDTFLDEIARMQKVSKPVHLHENTKPLLQKLINFKRTHLSAIETLL